MSFPPDRPRRTSQSFRYTLLIMGASVVVMLFTVFYGMKTLSGLPSTSSHPQTGQPAGEKIESH